MSKLGKYLLASKSVTIFNKKENKFLIFIRKLFKN